MRKCYSRVKIKKPDKVQISGYLIVFWKIFSITFGKCNNNLQIKPNLIKLINKTGFVCQNQLYFPEVIITVYH
jgi:hypothetical protein